MHRDCLVWGAAGFIGRHLTSHLLDLGHSVTVLCRDRLDRPQPEWANQVRWVTFSSDADFDSALSQALPGVGVVYNLAGSSGAVASNKTPLASMDSNCNVQLRFLNACREIGTKPHIVFPSSRLVYGPCGNSPVSEDRLTNPQSMYAVNKLCIEQYLEVASYLGHITYTICRITNPYGFDDTLNGGAYKILNFFVTNALSGQPITLFGDGSQLRDFIQISDVVWRLAACGTVLEARNQTLNIGSGVSQTLRVAAEVIRDICGADIQFKPWPAEYLAVESGDFVCGVSKANSILRPPQPLDLEEGLRRTIESYRRRLVTASVAGN